MKRSNFPDRRKIRHEEAVARQTTRTPADQIALLDSGGFVAARERKKLLQRLPKG